VVKRDLENQKENRDPNSCMAEYMDLLVHLFFKKVKMSVIKETN